MPDKVGMLRTGAVNVRKEAGRRRVAASVDQMVPVFPAGRTESVEESGP